MRDNNIKKVLLLGSGALKMRPESLIIVVHKP